ncbi:MAG: ABC transporter permease [Spirochaetales bacterium]|uniref:ABC transporter permease n=1 Tax=Candidatus Thalassospirochaeta sargassi TaxID=3119039 RepID=A0AAJ1IDP4_9SPIO|nr:ABC transporter permease [Spirochaetales bacterium]
MAETTKARANLQVKRDNLFMRFIRQKESAIFLALIGIMLVITIIAPKFATPGNLYRVARQISFVAIVAFGVFTVILTGGIDLSVGSIIGISGVTCGLAMAAGAGPFVAVIVGLVTGFGVGMINGILVSYVGITPFIVTLGMLSMARGAIWIITKGWPVEEIHEKFLIIGQGKFLGIPVPVVIAIVVAVAMHLFLRYTIFGRRLYAIGGNEEATRLSGINVKQIKCLAYGISGLMSAITGIILVARFSSAQTNAGDGWELDAIAAAVIGGTSLSGGSGSVLGVIIGAAIMGVIRNGLVLMKVSAYWQTAIMGFIIVLAAVIDRVKNR